MTGKIIINGNIGNFDDDEDYTDLVDVVGQVKKQPDATSFNVYINSVGGYVSVGKDIYNYLISLGLPITTIGSGIVASMATYIFMAGSKRMVQEGCKFMIHLPMGGVMGTADDISEYAKEMKKTQDELVGFYASKLDIPKDVIEPLLKEDLWLTEDKLSELGITTTEPLKAVAKAGIKAKKSFSQNSNPKPKKMADKKSKKDFVERLWSLLDDEGIDAVNKVLYDAENNEVVFPEVDEDATVSTGDKATINDQPAEGSIVLADGRTFVFEAGILTDIIEADEDAGEEDELATLREENEALKAEKAKAESEKKTLETELATAKANLKKKEKVIAKIKELENEFKTEPVNRQTDPKGNSKKESRFKAAMANIKK